MRALDRLSASSFIVTAPRPTKAEPSRRIASLLEITFVYVGEAGVAGGDQGEVPARADDRPRDIGAQIPARLDHELTLHSLQARHARELGDRLFEALPLGFDTNHVRTS